MNAHAETWNTVSQLLREARRCLPSGPGDPDPVPVGRLVGTLQEFEELLGHNELELAWDALAEVADDVGAPEVCWRKMAEAARLMRLQTKADRAARQAGQQDA